MRTQHLLSAFAIGATLVAGAASAAPAPMQDAKTIPHAESRRELSIPQIHDKLTAAGYRSIEKIEREHDAFEARAIDKNGARVKLYLDPQTGNILETRNKDSKRDRRSQDDS